VFFIPLYCCSCSQSSKEDDMMEDKKLDSSIVMEEITMAHPTAGEELLQLREVLKTEKEQKVVCACVCTYIHVNAHACTNCPGCTDTFTQITSQEDLLVLTCRTLGKASVRTSLPVSME